MSFILKTRQAGEISNKEREYFLGLKENEDYGFKYVPESHFKHIIKNVQRQRRKEDEERIWTSFVKEQELNSLKLNKEDVCPSMQSVKDLLKESIQDVDRELKRLEEDALPERSKRIYNNKPATSSKKSNTQVTNIKNASLKKTTTVKDNDACCSTILIPISEEEDISSYNKSQESKRASRSNAKKSSSDPSIVRKKHYSNQLLRASNDSENSSSPELSRRQMNDEDDNIYVRPDPLTIHKILSLQKKIGELLDEISFRLCRIPLPDGDNDMKRRQQRAMEFSIRFSRNYLYDLNRFVTSIQRHISAISPRAGLKQNRRSIKFHQETIEQKLIAAHQLLIHALIAYCNHIPSSILRGHPTKLKEVLQVVVDLKGICDKVQISANYFGSGDANVLPLRKELQDKCDIILSKLKLVSENEHRPTNYNNTESVLTLASTLVQNRKHSSRKNLSTRLSMYGMDVKSKKGDQRKKSHAYQKERRYSTRDIKVAHSGHGLVSELLYPSPVTHTSSSRDIIQIDTIKHTNYPKEDDIKTMMDGIPMDSENDSNLEAQNKCNDTTTTRQKSKAPQKKCSAEVSKLKSLGKKEENAKADKITNNEDLVRKVTTITKEHLSSLVPVIADLMSLVSKKNEVEVQPVSEASMETLLEFLQKYQSPKESDTKAPSNNYNCSLENSESLHLTSNSLCETQKRAKNMWLICMSSAEKDSEIPQYDASCQANYGTLKATGSSIDNSIQLIISNKTERHFLKYQREYQKLCQSKPMYSSNTQNKPWDVVAWISDKLVEELIIEIAKELQINDVIQKLFEMEFQEF